MITTIQKIKLIDTGETLKQLISELNKTELKPLIEGDTYEGTFEIQHKVDENVDIDIKGIILETGYFTGDGISEEKNWTRETASLYDFEMIVYWDGEPVDFDLNEMNKSEIESKIENSL